MRALLPLILLVLGGCTTYISRVSSLSDPDLTACCTYIIVPNNEGVDTSTIAWRRFESMVGKLVEQELDYVKAAPGQPADVGIVAAAGIGDPRTSQSTVPYWGKTGTSVTGSTTTGSVTSSGTSYGNTSTANSNVNLNTTYQTQDTYGIVTTTKTSTVYDRWLTISGYRIQKDSVGRSPQVWQTTVRSTGTSGALEQVIPYMLAATRKYVGQTTTGEKRVEISDGAEAVRSLTE